jgi:hypothetical protein
MAKVRAKAGGAKKPAKKGAASKKTSASRAAKRAPKPLSAAERQRLLKPADGFTELAERFATAWTSNRGLKVPGLSPAKILTMLGRAKKASAREDALRRKLEEKLRPLQDARLQAEHDAWKMVLDAYAVAKAQARLAPEIGRAFSFMGDALTRRARGKEKPAEPEPQAPPAG